MNESPWGARPRLLDAVDSWWRTGLIVSIIVANGVWEEALVLRAELIMLVRWTRDVIRYDVRWILQEKLQLMRRRAPPRVER